MYIIKLGKKYITKNGARVTDINAAYKLETLKDCSLFMARRLNVGEIASATIIEVEENVEEVVGFNIQNAKIEHGGTEIIEKKIFKPLDVDEIILEDNYFKTAFENIDGLDNLFNDISSIYNIAINFESYKQRLNKLYKENELKICDIYHYIEFHNLNACDGYKIYNRLHNILNYRRNIKDAINAITLLNNMFTDIDIENLSNILHAPDRSYRPRADKELFLSNNKQIDETVQD